MHCGPDLQATGARNPTTASVCAPSELAELHPERGLTAMRQVLKAEAETPDATDCEARSKVIAP